ncbi:FAD-binding Berberine family protein [Striga asiatica]|uniref:FAD-binding Berberine family protein n=1 Tax=Striga asiatica TaxID=4170 RepID=A0A5A7PKW9_STRAF|nr:FAD-binding Berberine family protein [Striga asiatica]
MTIYNSMFLVNKTDEVRLMRNKFHELGLRDEDFLEKSWIASVMIPAWKLSFKGKSDMVKTAIPRAVLRKLCEAVKQQSMSLVILTPYGGKMAEIPKDATLFLHCGNTLFMAYYVWQWPTEGKRPQKQAQNENWVRGIYETSVSSYPRWAYVNYRDLDPRGSIFR